MNEIAAKLKLRFLTPMTELNILTIAKIKKRNSLFFSLFPVIEQKSMI